MSEKKSRFFPINPVAHAEQVIYDVWVHQATHPSQTKPHLHTQKPYAYFKIWFCHTLDLKMKSGILSEAAIFSPNKSE